MKSPAQKTDFALRNSFEKIGAGSPGIRRDNSNI